LIKNTDQISRKISEEMKQPVYLNNHFTNCLIFFRSFTRIAILLLIVSFLLGPSFVVSASTDNQEGQNSTYYTYLPITSDGHVVYYVAPNGNDNNPGTLTSPWRTLSKAAEMIEPGVLVYLRGGIYREAVEFSRSGTHDYPIKILAYQGETPIIDGNNYDLPHQDGGALLEISGNYIYVSGLEVRYSSYVGVLVNGSHSTANKINAHHNLHSGMRISGNYSVIEYSNVWSNDMQNYNGKYSSGDSTALTASRHPTNAIIRNNIVRENWGIGLSTYEADGTIIEGNIVYDNYGPNIYLSDVTNVLFQRNFIYATGNMIGGPQVGIQLGDETLYPPLSSSNITITNNIVYHTRRNLACWHGSSGKMANVLIANNTFVNSTEESGIVFKENLQFDNVRFINNLIQQDGDLPIILLPDSHPGLSFSNNLWSKNARQSATGPGDITADPLLARTGDPSDPEWFKLTGISPAIGGAITLSEVTTDYFGYPREAPPDMGANEFFPDS
jgi:parallel beta-helix repeat protein